MDNRRKPHTEEHKRKISLATKGGNSMSFKKGHSKGVRFGTGQKGHNQPHSEESRKKISNAHKGKPTWASTHKEEMREISKKLGFKPPSNKGKKYSEEHKRKISHALKGENNHFWKGGVTPINQKIRSSRECKLWRTAVFERDNYTCIWCGDNGWGNLEADHIKPFALYPELRFAIDNGRTLCKSCHKTTNTYGGKLYKFIKNYDELK